MNVIEKRDFIHSHLHQLDEAVINEFYEKLQKNEILKEKLVSRSRKSETDIKSGRLFTRAEIEQKTINAGQ